MSDEVGNLLLLRIWNYLRGYVIIVVEGYFIEKFVNICARRQILLWDIMAQGRQSVVMKMSIRGFKLIRPVARKTKCRVRLKKKTGLPFVFNRYRRRKAFFAGAVLFIALLYIMISFIWSVEINGNKKLQTVELEKALARHGVKTGVLKYRIDTNKAVTGMMLDIGDISWISINVKGTKVRVDVRERIEIPYIIPKHIPCDVVAAKDGIIKRIIATEGIEAAAEGDSVRKGQVLISGSIPLKEGNDRFKTVHAMGTVIARTWYEEEVPVITKVTERVKTGRVINDHALVLFSCKIDLLRRKNKFSCYSATETRKKLKIGNDLVFPVEWVTVTYSEEQTVEAAIDEENAKKAAVDSAYRKAMSQVPEGAEVVKKSARFVQGADKRLYARVTLECLEDIGISRRTGGN
ncbi:MAG: sporulation protein YqfD [Acetivibrionales bacterium]|jgi:similar to stage IV sporulation protein